MGDTAKTVIEVIKKVDGLEEKHLPTRHDQMTHGGSKSAKKIGEVRFNLKQGNFESQARTMLSDARKLINAVPRGIEFRPSIVQDFKNSLRNLRQDLSSGGYHDDFSDRKTGGIRTEFDHVNFEDDLNTALKNLYSESGMLEKHLANRHDQKAHGGTRGATSKEVKTGSKKAASSLEKRLKGQKLGNHIIKAVKKTGEKKERLVIFEDGSGMFFPSFALAKLAWGGTGKNVGHGEAAKMFRTAGEMHKAGFASWIQANYLLRSNKKVFLQIIADAKAGKRKWNQKERRIVLTKSNIVERHHVSHEVEYERWLRKPKGKLLHEDTTEEEEAMNLSSDGGLDFYSEEEVLEGKHLPTRHDQQSHAGSISAQRLGSVRLKNLGDVRRVISDSIRLSRNITRGHKFQDTYHQDFVKHMGEIREDIKSGVITDPVFLEDSINFELNDLYSRLGLKGRWKSSVDKAMNSEQLSEEAMDKEFAEIEEVPMSELIKYGRQAGDDIVKKGYDDMEDDMEEEMETLEEEQLEDEELETGFEPSTMNEIETAFDIANELVSQFNGASSGEVISVKTFAEDGLGFLGPGINVYTDDDCFVIAVKEITKGDLTQEAEEINVQLSSANSFLQDLIGFLNDEEIPGLDDVYINNDDEAQVPVVSFVIDDGSEFRAYILGALDIGEGSDSDDLVEMSFAYPVEKADQVCLKTIWQVAYKFYTGKWISAAMQMQKAGKFDKAAEAFENARDGYQEEKNPKEWGCLDAWRQEMANKIKR